MKIWNIIATAGVLFWAASASAAPAARPATTWDEWDVIPGRVLVKYKAEKAAKVKGSGQNDNVPGLAHQRLEADNEKRFNEEAARRGQNNPGPYVHHLPRHFIGTFDPGSRTQVLKALSEDADVEYFEPDRLRQGAPTWGTNG